MRTAKLNNLWLTTIALGLSVGCGGPPSINGVVTYEGEPVKTGSITFSSPSAEGTPYASEIRDGKYKVSECRAGEMVVSISGYEMPEVPPGSTEPVYARDTVPYDAKGNMQTIEVTLGSQTLDFHLTAPE